MLSNLRHREIGLIGLNSLLFIVLLVATWRRFGDLLVDFPRELYHAWLVAQGAKPYLDFEHPHGAWALLWDGLVFRIFGAHSDVLLTNNALLAALLCIGIYQLLRLGWGKAPAGLTLLVCQVAFIFGGFLEMQIFNFIAPYNQSSLHAMVLAVWGLRMLAWAAQSSTFEAQASPAIFPSGPTLKKASPPHEHPVKKSTVGPVGVLGLSCETRQQLCLAAAGLVFGAILFTRADVALAYCATSLMGVIFLGSKQKAYCHFLNTLTIFLVAALFSVLVFALYFLLTLPSGLLLRAILGPWASVSRETLTTSRQLRHFGFDAPVSNLGRMLFWTGVIGSCFLLVRGWAHWCQRATQSSHPSPRTVASLPLLTFILPLAPLLAAWQVWAIVLWFRLPLTLPVISLALGVVSFRQLWCRFSRSSGTSVQDFARSLWACFALLMLLRMPLKAQVTLYGFYQALPATSLIFAWISWKWVAPLLDEPRRQPHQNLAFLVTAHAAAGLYLAFVITATLTLQANMRDRTRLVSLPGLALYTPASPDKARVTDVLLRGLARADELTSKGATFAAVPEGTLYHYVLRRPNPTLFDHLATVEISAFGENRIVAAYEKAAPDFVFLIHKYTADAPLFGSTPAFGKAFMKWLTTHYRCMERLGERPFTGINSHGVEIYVRNRTAGL